MYKLYTVTYSTKPASQFSVRAMHLVDDLISGANSVKDDINIMQTTKILARGLFKLRK